MRCNFISRLSLLSLRSLLTGGRCRSNCSGGKKKPCYFLARGTQELRQELYGAKDGCLILWVIVVRYRLLSAERKSCLRS